MRTREVWVHAVDLDNGATFKDIPAAVLERLLTDITTAWHTRGTDKDLVVQVTGGATPLTYGDTVAASPTMASGSLAAIAQWATGRGADGTTARRDHESNTPAPPAPTWI